MNLQQAAQQALEALTLLQGDIEWTSKSPTLKFVNSTVAALRTALAEPDSDYERGFVDGMNLQTKRSVDKAVNCIAEPRPIQECYGDCPTNPQTCPNPCNFEGRPKPEQKPQTTHWEGCETVHPECRKPEQEPVAWVEPKWLDPDTRGWPSDSFESVPIEGWLPLYTAPTPRKPLTDEEIERACVPLGAAMLSFTEVARAIERAHGIGEQHE